jgi:hypothetical protein
MFGVLWTLEGMALRGDHSYVGLVEYYWSEKAEIPYF